MDGCGQVSLVEEATPAGGPRTQVQLTALSDQDRHVRLEWTLPMLMPPVPADDRTGFQYRQAVGGVYGSWIRVPNSNADTLFHVVAGLMNGTHYAFEVRAVNGARGGEASNEVFVVPSTTPGAPTNLRATAGDEQVRLNWTPGANGGRGHHPLQLRNENRLRGLRRMRHGRNARQARRVRDVPHPH